MEKRDVCAFLVGCRAEEFMAYRDVGEEGAVVVGPDGRKHVFDAAYLGQAEPKAKDWFKRIKQKPEVENGAHKLKPTPKPKTKTTTKRQTTTKRKRATPPKEGSKQ